MVTVLKGYFLLFPTVSKLKGHCTLQKDYMSDNHQNQTVMTVVINVLTKLELLKLEVG